MYFNQAEVVCKDDLQQILRKLDRLEKQLKCLDIEGGKDAERVLQRLDDVPVVTGTDNPFFPLISPTAKTTSTSTPDTNNRTVALVFVEEITSSGIVVPCNECNKIKISGQVGDKQVDEVVEKIKTILGIQTGVGSVLNHSTPLSTDKTVTPFEQTTETKEDIESVYSERSEEGEEEEDNQNTNLTRNESRVNFNVKRHKLVPVPETSEAKHNLIERRRSSPLPPVLPPAPRSVQQPISRPAPRPTPSPTAIQPPGPKPALRKSASTSPSSSVLDASHVSTRNKLSQATVDTQDTLSNRGFKPEQGSASRGSTFSDTQSTADKTESIAEQGSQKSSRTNRAKERYSSPGSSTATLSQNNEVPNKLELGRQEKIESESKSKSKSPEPTEPRRDEQSVGPSEKPPNRQPSWFSKFKRRMTLGGKQKPTIIKPSDSKKSLVKQTTHRKSGSNSGYSEYGSYTEFTDSDPKQKGKKLPKQK